MSDYEELRELAEPLERIAASEERRSKQMDALEKALSPAYAHSLGAMLGEGLDKALGDIVDGLARVAALLEAHAHSGRWEYVQQGKQVFRIERATGCLYALEQKALNSDPERAFMVWTPLRMAQDLFPAAFNEDGTPKEPEPQDPRGPTYGTALRKLSPDERQPQCGWVNCEREATLLLVRPGGAKDAPLCAHHAELAMGPDAGMHLKASYR